MYLKKLAAKQYRVNGGKLTSVIATAHPDNPGSIKVLKNLGFQYVGNAEREGNPRDFFMLNFIPFEKLKEFTPEELTINTSEKRPVMQSKL
jgi:RimJ/RimL family protein N-acetyltransferase